MKYYEQLKIPMPPIGSPIEAYELRINPPLIEKELDESDIMSCLQQNGWKKTTRKRNGKTRIYLSKEI